MEMRQNYSVLGSLVVFLYRSCSERLSSKEIRVCLSRYEFRLWIELIVFKSIIEEVLVGNGVLL